MPDSEPRVSVNKLLEDVIRSGLPDEYLEKVVENLEQIMTSGAADSLKPYIDPGDLDTCVQFYLDNIEDEIRVLMLLPRLMNGEIAV